MHVFWTNQDFFRIEKQMCLILLYVRYKNKMLLCYMLRCCFSTQACFSYLKIEVICVGICHSASRLLALTNIFWRMGSRVWQLPRLYCMILFIFFGIAFWHIKMVYAKAFQVLSTFGGAPANLNFSTQFRRSPQKNWVFGYYLLRNGTKRETDTAA